MKSRIIFLGFLILISCKEIGKKDNAIKADAQIETTDVETTTQVIESDVIETQTLHFSESVEPFIEKVLGTNKREHEFDINNNEIQHLEIFEQDGLQKIVAFSDKRYPKRVAPNYYEHFILFALQYDDVLTAKKSYDEIKRISKIGGEAFDNLGVEEKQRFQKMEGATKPGGMICQKGKYVFSLVKTCRNTPIGGKWGAYENLFLSFLTTTEEEIMVLNANCGQMRYVEEKRKPTPNKS